MSVEIAVDAKIDLLRRDLNRMSDKLIEALRKPVWEYQVEEGATTGTLSGSGPAWADCGAPPPGKIWQIQWVYAGPSNPFASSSGNSFQNFGTVTTPAANTRIAQLSGANIPPAGLYTLTFYFNYGATGDIADNIQAVWNSSQTLNLPNPGGNNATMPPVSFMAQLNGINPVYLQNNAAGAAGAIYNATVIATPVMSTGLAGVSATLYVGGMVSGGGPSVSQARMSGIVIPSSVGAPRKLYALAGQHVIVGFGGSGLSGLGQGIANVGVLVGNADDPSTLVDF